LINRTPVATAGRLHSTGDWPQAYSRQTTQLNAILIDPGVRRPSTLRLPGLPWQPGELYFQWINVRKTESRIGTNCILIALLITVFITVSMYHCCFIANLQQMDKPIVILSQVFAAL